ncbi:MAG: YfhO family protein [Bacteroidota bacterium]
MRKNLLIHGLMILTFLLITLMVHYPTFLSGKKINQHDILQGTGGNQQLKYYRTKTGEEALWNPYMFSGMPAYLTGVQYSGDLLKYVYEAYGLWMGHPVSILFISMVSFYIMLLNFKVRPLIAAMSSIAFGLNGFNIIGIMAGHNAKIAAVALMPLVLAGIQLTFSGKRWLGVSLTALALGLEIRANHPQITYYLALIVLVYGINELLKVMRSREFKAFSVKSGLLIIAAILAIGANYGRLASTLEYSKYSIRGKSELAADQAASGGLDREYAFRYSNGIAEPLFLFVPNIFGGSSQEELSVKSEVANALRKAGYSRSQVAQRIKSMPTYWGDQPLTAPYFAGTLAIMLFILGTVVLPKHQKIWLIVLVILGIMMSWGKNFSAFNNFLFDYLPGYNKFRSVTFTIIISIFALNLLGALGLEKLLSMKWNKETRKKIFLTFGIGGGFLTLLLVCSGALNYRGVIDTQLPDWFANALREDRQSLLIRDTMRALLFGLGFGLSIWFFFKKNIKAHQVLIVLLALVFVDNLALTKRFLGEEKFVRSPIEDYFKMNEADQVLLSFTQDGDRVLNLQNPFNENRTSYTHASLGGYHGAKIRRYQDLIEHCLESEIQRAIQKIQSQSLDFSDLHILNMLNASYFYAGEQQNGVFKNSSANGAAWIASEIIPVNSPDEEIDKVCQINTKTQAVIDQSKFSITETNGIGSIILIEKTPNRLVYESSVNGGAATGVFSEIYYPKGWSATIDGKDKDILRANYVLRALEIPEGKHEIVFEFKPKVYANGNTIMLVSSILVLVGCVGGVYFELRQ